MIKKIIIGIIGGGQLGAMLSTSAHQLGFSIKIYSDANDSPATQINNNVTIGNYNDEEKLGKFAEECDILTYEFENIDYQILKKLEKKYNNLYPNSQALYISQNRLREKNFLQDLGIPIAEFTPINSSVELEETIKTFPLPAILKTIEFGYDGKGQYKIDSQNEIEKIDYSQEYILEKCIDFQKEVSLILVRNQKGEIRFFPIPTNVHSHGILNSSIAPSNLSSPLTEEIHIIGKKIADKLDYIGVLAIEFFIDYEKIMVNEMAPRVHNSGHFSMDVCNISQFEAHIRAITNLPLVDIKLERPCQMLNLIGDDVNNIEKYLKNGDAKLHLYGKNEVKKNRKMGHVNLINS